MKKIITIILVFALCFSSSVFVDAANPVDVSNSATGVFMDDIIIESTRDGSYIKTVTATGLDLLRNSFAQSNSRTIQNNPYIELMRELGFSDFDIECMGTEEITNMFQNAETVEVASTYYRTDETGNSVVISEEDYLSAANEIALLSTDNDGYNNENSTDGYMNIITIATYFLPSTQNGEKGWYHFSGTFRFLNVPSGRLTDAASLYADEVMWSQDTSEIYSYMAYQYTNGTSGTTSSTKLDKTTEDKHLYADGVYYSWDLPKGENVTLITIHVRAKARVSDYTSNRAFNLFTRYEHTYATVDVDVAFEWTTNSFPGVAVSASPSYDSTSYTSYCAIDYQPDITS